MSPLGRRSTDRRSTGRRIATGVCVLALAAVSACSSSSSDGPKASSNSTGTGGTKSAAPSGVPAGVPAGSYADHPATGSAVKVGVISSEGGAISEPTARQAAQAATDYANDHLGGLAGHTMKLVICKSQDTSSAVPCANQMVDSNVVGVVVAGSPFGSEIVPILVNAGIAYTTYNGTSGPELTTKNFVYDWTGGFSTDLKGMATVAARAGAKSVVMFILDLPAVALGAKTAGEPVFKAAGVSLKIVPIPAGAADATPQVTAGLNSNPGAVAIVGDAGTCVSVLKALSTLASSKLRRLVNQSCTDPSVFAALGSSIDGTEVLSGADGSSDDPEAVLYRTIMKQYAPGVAITGPTLTGYQAMLGFIRMAQGTASPITAASVNTAIRSAKAVPVPVGHGATMTCDGTAAPGLPAICNTADIVLTINGGKLTDAKLVK